MRKLFIALLFFLLSFFLIFPASAQENWRIKNFNSEVTIQQDGVVGVLETISVDFGSLQKHGIYRDIPYVYQDNGKKIYTKIELQEISIDGSSAEYKLNDNGANMRMQIGDPDYTISGKHIYSIRYKVTGVLRGFSAHDELYWNVTGNNWDVPIDKASATVNLPQEIISKVTCYEGYADSTAACLPKLHSLSQASFSSLSQLLPNQGLTVVVGYKKGVVPILAVSAPKPWWEQVNTLQNLFAFLLPFVVGISFVVWFWIKQGRDKPFGLKETIVVEFEPPENLRPAEIGVLVDERADTLDVSATIIDLAAQGFLTIVEKKKTWLFGSTDYELKRTTKDAKQLLAYEKLLLEKLFVDKKIVKMSDLKNAFYDDLAKVKDQLYKDIVAKNLFPQNPNSIRVKFLVIGALIAFGGAVLVILFLTSDTFAISFNLLLASFGAAIVLVGLFLILMSRFLPRRSFYGRQLYRRTRGYRLFIENVEKYRQQYFEKENMFNIVLPYAIVFGLTAKFAKALKDMDAMPKQPSWYYGTETFNSVAFGSSVNSFSSVLSSAIASSPSGSGFSGGGSSGGGFGGGGGGSW